MSSTPKVDLDQLCDAIEAAKKQVARIEEDVIVKSQQRIMDQLREQGSTSATTKSGRKVTVVEGVRTSWDSDILQDVLGPNLWEEVTKRVLDPNRLESVVERENIDPKTLKDAVTETKVKPYVKITPPKKSTST